MRPFLLKTIFALSFMTFAAFAASALAMRPDEVNGRQRHSNDCDPTRFVGVLRDNVIWWAREDRPVALAAQFTNVEDDVDRVAWHLTVKTMDGRPVAAWNGKSPLANGDGFASIAFDGRDNAGKPLAAGNYVYIFEAHGYTANGGFLRVLGTDEELPVLEDAREPLAASANPNVPYNFYYGVQHSHTIYSDGGTPVASCTGSVQTPHSGSDPAAAYAYAKTSGGLNWIDVIDHNHLLNEVCSGDCSVAGIRARYQNGFTAAAAATDANFVGFYGMEWSTNANGHISLADINKIVGPAAETYSEVIVEHTNYLGLYTAVNNPANQLATGAVGSFCHPESSQFSNYAQNAAGLNFMVGIAVISGSASSNATDFRDQGTRYSGAKTTSDKYQYVLQRGWKIGPEGHQDNHCANYGTHSRTRTVVLSTSLTRSALMAARKARRFFTTSDLNAQMFFGTADYARVMGETFTTSSATLSLRMWAQDPDGSAISTVTLYEGDPAAGTGSPTTVAMTNAGGGSYTATVNVPATGSRYWYTYVTLANGGELWSAPIWVSRSGGCSDTTLPTATVTAPTASTVTGTVTVSATGSDNVGVTGMTLKIDGVQVASSTTGAVSYSWNTTGLTAGSSHTIVATASDACGNVGTSTTKTVTIGSSCSDTTLPTATVTAPANGASVSGTVTVTASGTDNVAVTAMTLKVDGTQVATSTSGSLSYSWNTSGLTAGSSHTLVATASDACGNTQTSATTTVTIASTFVNPVVNGSFETGVPPSSWTETGTYEQSTGTATSSTGVSVSPQSGTKMMWMAGYNNADDYLYQNFTVPNVAANVTLSFQTNIKTLDGTTTAYDNFYADVYNSAGTTRLGTVVTLSNKNASSGWVARTGSLNTWKGQTIRLRFHATNDVSNETDFFVDNVVVTSP